MRAVRLFPVAVFLCPVLLSAQQAATSASAPHRPVSRRPSTLHRPPQRAGQSASVPRYERFSCTYVVRPRRSGCIADKLAQYPRVAYITWYGDSFRGKETTSGEIFVPERFTAASRELPFGTRLRVTNLLNGRSVIVRINDRGPWRTKCVLDMSLGAARALRYVSRGYVKAYIEVLSAPGTDVRIAEVEPPPARLGR